MGDTNYYAGVNMALLLYNNVSNMLYFTYHNVEPCEYIKYPYLTPDINDAAKSWNACGGYGDLSPEDFIYKTTGKIIHRYRG